MALAPCFIGNITDFYDELDESVYRLLATAMNVLGIESLFGPEWAGQVETICMFVGGDSTECQALKGLELGPIHEGGSITGFSEVGVKQSLHMVQNILEDRFQEFADYYIFGWWWTR